ncbi:MAG TPA: penicillin-binding protein 2 [Aeromicrobium sp.]|nr:penicillin-binding protein 2 [Aeromicrobium sp.]
MTRQRLSRRRLRFCLYAFIAVFVVFAGRLFQIQALDMGAYAAQAVAAGTARVTVPATRGEIRDRNDQPLASSIQARNLTADPYLTAPNAPAIAAVLREQLGDQIDYFDTIDKLRKEVYNPRTKQMVPARFVYLAKRLPADQAAQVLDALKEYPGIFSENVGMRTYPGGRLAANLIGFVDADGKGRAGLEMAEDKRLTGSDGQSTFEVSPLGVRIPMADTTVKKMVPGTDVVSSIDRDLQWYADQRIATGVRKASADWGLAITMDVRTGEIVQMSQAPSFDLDNPRDRQMSVVKNLAVEKPYEPGSVLKTVTMAALADQGKIRPETHIVVPSQIKVNQYRIGDYWQHGVLHLTAAGVIAKSSNLGTVVAARHMTPQSHWSYLRKFGFGQRTGIGLAGETAGILRDPDLWAASHRATISFGQGIAVNAVQVIRAVGAIANGGVLVTPTVVDAYVLPDGHRIEAPPGPTSRAVSPEAAAIVRRMMEQVPRSDGGTAPMAKIAGYRVAGKTGTAWRIDPQTGKYIRGQNTVSFIGFAPADKPRFITYVVLDKPYRNAGGGTAAAPVFHDIMSMALERFGVVPTGSTSPKVKLDW